MNSFSLTNYFINDKSNTLFSYPAPISFATKMMTPNYCIFFPMDFSEYSAFKYPSKPLNILSDYSDNKNGSFRRAGDYNLPFKIASLYHMPKPKVSFYTGRTFAENVCLIYY